VSTAEPVPAEPAIDLATARVAGTLAERVEDASTPPGGCTLAEAALASGDPLPAGARLGQDRGN
jgi:hypothetical protein